MTEIQLRIFLAGMAMIGFVGAPAVALGAIDFHGELGPLTPHLAPVWLFLLGTVAVWLYREPLRRGRVTLPIITLSIVMFVIWIVVMAGIVNG